jgi:hypothetical protein
MLASLLNFIAGFFLLVEGDQSISNLGYTVVPPWGPGIAQTGNGQEPGLPWYTYAGPVKRCFPPYPDFSAKVETKEAFFFHLFIFYKCHARMGEWEWHLSYHVPPRAVRECSQHCPVLWCTPQRRSFLGIHFIHTLRAKENANLRRWQSAENTFKQEALEGLCLPEFFAQAWLINYFLMAVMWLSPLSALTLRLTP